MTVGTAHAPTGMGTGRTGTGRAQQLQSDKIVPPPFGRVGYALGACPPYDPYCHKKKHESQLDELDFPAGAGKHNPKWEEEIVKELKRRVKRSNAHEWRHIIREIAEREGFKLHQTKHLEDGEDIIHELFDLASMTDKEREDYEERNDLEAFPHVVLFGRTGNGYAMHWMDEGEFSEESDYWIKKMKAFYET